MKARSFRSSLSMTLIGLTCLVPALPSIAQIPCNLTTLYNTGVDNAHNSLASNGMLDPHYDLIASADPNYPAGGPAIVDQTYATALVWVNSNNAISKWVVPQGHSVNGVPPGSPLNGLYTYKTTFDLTGFNPSTASILGDIAADDGVSAIRLNGVAIPPVGGINYAAYTAFSITSGFGNGINSLEFDVQQIGSGPTGLRVEMCGNATAVPEPSACAMLLIGTSTLGMVCRFRRRRQR